MSTHSERASRMGYGGASSAKPKAAPAAAASIYEKSIPGEIGSHDAAISAWEDRRSAKFRDDPERRDEVHLEARQVKAFALKHDWTPAETQAALSRMTEREAFPRSDEAKQKVRPLTFDQLRIKQGSEAAVREMLAKADQGQRAFAADCPTMARRATEIGAAEDPEVIEIFARHPEPISKEK